MTADELRRRLIELDDRIRDLPADAFADEHARSTERDEHRTRLRAMLTDDLDAVSDEWAIRAGHKGGHSVDEGEQRAAARIVSPGEGGAP